MKKTRNLVAALSILGALAYSGHTAHAAELNSVHTKEAVEYVHQHFANNKSIGYGSNHKVVKSIQSVLGKLGYDVPVTGKFGARTASAVKSFQNQHGIKPTGTVDSKTAAVMMEDLTVFNKQETLQSINTLETVSYGCTNPVVKSIQVVLNSLGYNIPETGYFGVVTQNAVKDFQGKHDLRKNGIVNASTANAIIEAASQQKVSSAAQKATKQTLNLSSKTNYYVKVDTNKERVYVYHKTNGSWSQIKELVCSTGAPTNPTIKGIFATTGAKDTSLRIRHKNEDIYVNYFTQIKGNYLFHSVPLDKNGNITDGRLGQAVSAGCVRLSIEDAKYIYNIIPTNTTVKII
ncbi:hypothetical protein CPJCM30710_33470 [Clostridium polyendosporum]|uniref:L,D-TPase catalytic domain-containing protein n=1 Tax=Clostridium polyendosporum TaxID=69208 RepID=A0A919S2G1_9CLOT|nr:peptidoglycan-binding protein [Clostridium polyendosporum]GIM30681.1 hypothetical protein CPJCM30710_33470 [Clostridium polyendosporum]